MIFLIGQALYCNGNSVVFYGGLFFATDITFHGNNILFASSLINICIWVSDSYMSARYICAYIWVCQISNNHTPFYFKIYTTTMHE